MHPEKSSKAKSLSGSCRLTNAGFCSSKTVYHYISSCESLHRWNLGENWQFFVELHVCLFSVLAFL